MREFKFLQKNKSYGTDINIVYPEDIINPLSRIAYRDGYIWALMGNHMIGSPYLSSPEFLHIWNRGWINQQMENQYERI